MCVEEGDAAECHVPFLFALPEQILGSEGAESQCVGSLSCRAARPLPEHKQSRFYLRLPWELIKNDSSVLLPRP